LEGIEARKVWKNNKTIEEFFDNNLPANEYREGFVQAYLNMLDAMADNDRNFIGNACEPVLAENIISGIDRMKANGYSLRRNAVSPPRIEMAYNKLSILFGQKLNRGSPQTSKPHNTSKDFAIQFNPGFIGLMIPANIKAHAGTNILCLFNLIIELKTNTGLELVQGDPSSGTVVKSIPPNTDLIHRFTFSIDSQRRLGISEVEPLLDKMGGKDGSIQYKPLINFLLEENYNWIISDIDDYFLNKGLQQ